MDTNAAKRIVQETFQSSFDKDKFKSFVLNLFNRLDESKAFHARGHVKETDDSVNQNIVVYINKKGLFFIDSVQTKVADVIEAIQKKAGTKGDKTVFVKADTAVPYGKVVELVDRIKHIGGVRYVALATSKVD